MASASTSSATTIFGSHSPARVQAAIRRRFIGFVADEATAGLLREVLEPALPGGQELHVVGFRATLELLSGMRTPEIVLIDLSGESQPLNAIQDLAEVVEAGAVILAIGENREVSFYRAITRGMGVCEYLQKPLTRDAVERRFLPWIRADAEAVSQQRGGRLVTVAGVRGGVGCSTVAANLAWAVGSEMRRHTVLLDSDLHMGTAALALNVQPTTGLRTALEAPDRVDHLLIERAAQPAGERLHVLAAAEPLTGGAEYTEGGAAMLCQTLKIRYNFVIADVGARQMPLARDLQYLAQHKIIVLDPTMLAIRNFEKISRLPHSPEVSPKLTVVLNRAGRPGGLARSYLEHALGFAFHVVIPDLPRQLGRAAQFGEPAAERTGAFRNGILNLAKLIAPS